MLSNESTPTSASDLPQEIIDIIIDEFFVDIITLRLCSTLCRSFSSRARAHLFHTIHLTPNKCSKFESTCLSSPEIPSLVKHISFSEFRTNPCPARDIVGATINLEHISLMNCDLLPFARSFGELEPVRRTSVTHVSIQSWGVRFKEICLLLEQFPSTDTLELEGQTFKTFESKAFVETLIGRRGLPIRKLDLRISQELNPFIDCFRSVGKLDIPFSVNQLRYLSVDFVRCWDLPQLDALLKETSHTLEELQFICCDYPYHWKTATSLTNISHLRRLSFNLRYGVTGLNVTDSSECPIAHWWQLNLATIGDVSRIEHIVISVALSEYNTEYLNTAMWSKFDAVLSAPSMASLKLVTIDISYRFTRLASHLPRIQRDVNEAFVALRERRLLDFQSSRIYS
ncbi:hypothetical protein IW261DRAFT_801992 [Armillaria novae-zelandiae]|uniref:F-box domain-containing protein n=1 Tax=Armillaria novae-zelandiae TaxID=153914 RepID=A0AA39PNS9_9AGAR|nr:hypothetical protein IW261DRAFT_801992 [Armillaria novae-zelandiae]